ncbi:hypothetical protein IFM89_020793, partial [Coptis chinensis]
EYGLLHTTCGTPNYVAPEVVNSKGYDGAKADLWSCGVILFVLMEGYFPFEDSNLMALYKNVIIKCVCLGGGFVTVIVLKFFSLTIELAVVSSKPVYMSAVIIGSRLMTNGIPLNALSYSVLIQGLCRGRNLEDAADFCVEMLKAGHFPNASTLTTLIDGLCKDKGV